MDELFEKRKKIIYEFICDEFYVPMKLKELSMLLQDQKGELKAVMDSLEKEGKVHVTQKGKYIKGEAKQLRGMFQANARGFGFVTVEGESEDIFISEDDMNGAMQGDEVEVVITKAPEGKRISRSVTFSAGESEEKERSRKSYRGEPSGSSAIIRAGRISDSLCRIMSVSCRISSYRQSALKEL